MYKKIKFLVNNNIFKLRPLIQYFTISVFVTIIDFIFLFVFMKVTKNIIFSNTIGIIIGATIQINLNYKYVYKHSLENIDILFFIVTFFINLLMADSLIFISFSILKFNVFISKIISVSIPFFITYQIRDFLNSNREIYILRLDKIIHKNQNEENL